MLEQIQDALAEIARDVDTLHQIETIQQQHQATLASAQAIADRLSTDVTALQHTLAQLGYHTVPEARTTGK
ncbi:hypothetical protein ACQP1O_17245 [Nocardia sp. CA-151230]|uniref:hypothetical protein n=1 Tax=Nocardia sp. CA-151230 TaxID=3239982 RepID=UPI003D8C328D